MNRIRFTDRSPVNLAGLLTCLTLTATFATDLFTPEEYVVWPLYILAIALAASWVGRPSVIVVAATCTVLMLVDWYPRLPGEGLRPSVVNAMCAVLVIWVSALLIAGQEDLLTAARKSESARRQNEEMLRWQVGELDSRRVDALRLAEEAEKANAGLLAEIEERKAVERHLRQSWARHRAVVETASDAFISLDEGGRITSWNQKAEELFGWPRGDALDRSLDETILPEGIRAEYRDGLETFLAGGQSGALNRLWEMSARCRDGREVPVQMTIWPTRSGDGWMFHACVRALTGEQQAERERTRFFDLSRDLLCIATMDGRFHRVNPAFRHVLGHSPSELTGIPYVEFVHPEDRAMTEAESERLTSGGESINFRNRYRRADGSYVWLEWSARSYPLEELIYASARVLDGPA